jgi:antirestriction protein
MPRIYVACLASYNNGVLHGVWIDCEGQSSDDIQTEVNDMLRDSRFPNVEVDCPDCESPASARDLADAAYQPCDTCHGRGKVPSAEEWAIHDHEGFGSLIEESTSFDRVAELAELIEEHGEAFIDFAGNIDDATGEAFQEAYQGQFNTLGDWAESFLEDTGGLPEIPENLRNYFDYDSYGRDAQLGGDIWMSNNGHVFWNH